MYIPQYSSSHFIFIFVFTGTLHSIFVLLLEFSLSSIKTNISNLPFSFPSPRLIHVRNAIDTPSSTLFLSNHPLQPPPTTPPHPHRPRSPRTPRHNSLLSDTFPRRWWIGTLNRGRQARVPALQPCPQRRRRHEVDETGIFLRGQEPAHDR